MAVYDIKISGAQNEKIAKMMGDGELSDSYFMLLLFLLAVLLSFCLCFVPLLVTFLLSADCLLSFSLTPLLICLFDYVFRLPCLLHCLLALRLSYCPCHYYSPPTLTVSALLPQMHRRQNTDT